MIYHAILWHYSDRSDFGIVGVYDNEKRAQEVKELLTRFHDGLRTFTLVSGVIEA